MLIRGRVYQKPGIFGITVTTRQLATYKRWNKTKMHFAAIIIWLMYLAKGMILFLKKHPFRS